MVVATQQVSRQIANNEARSRMFEQDDVSSTSILEDMELATHLLSIGQTLCEQTYGAVARLSNEVKQITGGRAQLTFGHHRNSKKGQGASNILITLPVQFGNVVYGTLSITSDSDHIEQLSIPLSVAQLLAQACSWLLYTLEQSAFLQGQCQQLDYQINGPLTRREREVLGLMCQGYNQEAIANLLCIAPATVGKHRQHIYEQLGVHCERDALLVAYQVGLFSLIEDNFS